MTPFADILDLENISGNGFVVLGGEDFEHLKPTLEMLEQAGIQVINGANLGGFSTPKKELADNSRAGAVVLNDQHDDVDIWLCSEEKAESIEYGFADDTDWIKIVKTADMGTVYGGFYYDTDDLTVTLYDSNGKNGVAVDLDESGCFSLTDLKNGTYYMRFSVTGNSSVEGWIETW